MKKGEDLKSQWIELVSKYSDNEKLTVDMFNSIIKCYNTPNRYYHNLDHIKTMLLEVKKFRRKVLDYDSMRFAIWFHDIVYDTKRSDNEEKSAEYAKDFLDNIKFEKLNKVSNLILKTKKHQIDESVDDFDTKFFLDLDLLILGTSQELYHRYTEKIRKEYSYIPNEIFFLERAKILNTFLKEKKIFKTEEYFEEFENIARRNLQFELKDIQSHKIG